ncbi:hypothetical protein Ct61P_08428 [Colletotrichum tofieldiae]|nr:hypothetical protein Ct61P_08428 [Colletotrichum tofieldiae]
MCLAENIYYVNCGCWEGQHIRWECPRSSPRGGTCPDVECSGVFRKWGRCLVCERRQAQQQQHALVAGDRDDEDGKVTLLREVLRQILGATEESTQSDETIGSLGDVHAGRDAALGLVSSRGAGPGDGAAWHRRWDPYAPGNEARRHADAPGTCGTGKVVPKPERWTLDRCCRQHGAGSHGRCGNQDAAASDRIRGESHQYSPKPVHW